MMSIRRLSNASKGQLICLLIALLVIGYLAHMAAAQDEAPTETPAPVSDQIVIDSPTEIPPVMTDVVPEIGEVQPTVVTPDTVEPTLEAPTLVPEEPTLMPTTEVIPETIPVEPTEI